jgi:ABC-type amino acid transport substrate-binding protein
LLCSTDYRLLGDSFSGSLSADGTWSGLIGVLARREADVAVTGTTMTPKRAEVVDFTLPIFQSRYSCTVSQRTAYTILSVTLGLGVGLRTGHRDV